MALAPRLCMTCSRFVWSANHPVGIKRHTALYLFQSNPIRAPDLRIKPASTLISIIAHLSNWVVE